MSESGEDATNSGANAEPEVVFRPKRPRQVRKRLLDVAAAREAGDEAAEAAEAAADPDRTGSLRYQHRARMKERKNGGGEEEEEEEKEEKEEKEEEERDKEQKAEHERIPKNKRTRNVTQKRLK